MKMLASGADRIHSAATNVISDCSVRFDLIFIVHVENEFILPPRFVVGTQRGVENDQRLLHDERTRGLQERVEC